MSLFMKKLKPIATKLPLGTRSRVQDQNTSIAFNTRGDTVAVEAVRTAWVGARIAAAALLHVPINSVTIRN